MCQKTEYNRRTQEIHVFYHDLLLIMACVIILGNQQTAFHLQYGFYL